MSSFYKGYLTKTYNSALFVRVFYHSTKIDRGSDTWFKDQEISFVNKRHKFSVISSLFNDFKINSKYEFLIVYPNLENPVYWRQETNPIENVSSVGYEALNSFYPTFKGLARSSDQSATFIDGTPGFYQNYYFYSIGAKKNYGSKNVIPASYTQLSNGADGTLTTEVTIWMKIKDKSMISLLPLLSSITCKSKSASFKNVAFIITLLIAT